MVRYSEQCWRFAILSPGLFDILFFHFFSYMVLGFVSLVVVFGGWGLWLPFLELGFLVDWVKGL